MAEFIGETVAPPEKANSSSIFEPGDAVAIQGLVGAAQHNKRVGYVVKLQAAKGRYAVRLGPAANSPDGTLLAVKPANLVFAAPPARPPEDANSSSSNSSGKANGALLRVAAAKNQVDEVLRLALLLGGVSSVDAADAYGESAVHQAAANGHVGMVALLVGKLQCDPHRRAADGATPLHVVRQLFRKIFRCSSHVQQ